MFEASDILILGDSYCARRNTETTWPRNLVLRLTGTHDFPRGQGYGGASWWSTKKRLMKELSICKPKVLILCHTEPNRIPSDENLPLNAGSLLRPNYRDWYSDEIRDAGQKYYRYLYSPEFHFWSQYNWFLDLDETLKNWHIPIVIHLHCFENDYVFNYGTTSKEYLSYFSPKDENGDLFWDDDNHLTKEQNLQLAASLHRAIKEYNPNDRLKDLRLFA